MPRNDACTHRKCGGKPCRMLTPEELKPSDGDLIFAQELIDDGWLSTSAKFHLVGKLPANFPTAQQMMAPNMRGTEHAREFMEWWDHHRRWCVRCHGTALEKKLTTRQFRAFKVLGGGMA